MLQQLASRWPIQCLVLNLQPWSFDGRAEQFGFEVGRHPARGGKGVPPFFFFTIILGFLKVLMGPNLPDPCAPQGANVQVAQAGALAWCMFGFKNTYHMCEANQWVPYNVRITEFFKQYPGASTPFKVGILIAPHDVTRMERFSLWPS